MKPSSSCAHVYVSGAVVCRLCGAWRQPKCSTCNGTGALPTTEEREELREGRLSPGEREALADWADGVRAAARVVRAEQLPTSDALAKTLDALADHYPGQTKKVPMSTKKKPFKYVGLHPYRFQENPEEERFAKAWNEQNVHGNNLAHLLSTGDNMRPPQPTEREHVVAATVVQWLGSSVGQVFLRDLGYEKNAPPRGRGEPE